MQPLLRLALEHHRAGRPDAAEQACRELLQAEPANPDALHFLGMLSHEQGRNDEAVELIEQAHRHVKPHAASLNNLGIAYLASQRPREAKRCFARALALKPDFAEAHSNLGDALDALGEAKAAERSYRRSLALKPGRAIAHYGLGNLLGRLGRLAEAEQAYRAALAAQPDLAAAHYNLGLLLAGQGRLDEAERCHRSALELNPGHVGVHHHLGIALAALGRTAEAEESFRAALDADPDAVEPLVELGNLLHGRERYVEAEAARRRALALQPDLAAAHFNLGATLAAVDRHEEALEAYRRAVELAPGHAKARWALALSQVPLVFAAGDDPARCRAAFAAELGALERWCATNAAGDADAIVLHPFRLAYQEEDNRPLLAQFGALSAGILRDWLARQSLPPAAPARHERIRLGIVSAHVYDQSVWTALVKGWLHGLDRTRFEVDVFHLGAADDGETALARSQAAYFAAGPRPLRDWVAAIRARAPDALLYPEIGMNMTTVKLASLRLAPVQLTAWGHPETTGLPTIDGYLSAELLEPPGAEARYTERLVQLPNLGCSVAPGAVEPLAPDLTALGIDERRPVLVCPGTPFKYAPRHDSILADIARRLPDCQFVFFTYRVAALSAKLRRRLATAFERSGLEFERHALFVPWQSPAAFHGLMRRADVYLDTIGFSGFNTAMQGIEAGVPIVTRAGAFMRGRLAAGILERIGLAELVAADDAGYVALAVRLVEDAGYRAAIRERIAATRHVLFDDPAPIRALEAYLAEVVRR